MNAIDIYAIKHCRQLSLKLRVHRMLTSLWVVNERVLWCVYSLLIWELWIRNTIILFPADHRWTDLGGLFIGLQDPSGLQ